MRLRVVKLDGVKMPDGSDAYIIERRSQHDLRWHRQSGCMAQAEADAIVQRANDYTSDAPDHSSSVFRYS